MQRNNAPFNIENDAIFTKQDCFIRISLKVCNHSKRADSPRIPWGIRRMTVRAGRYNNEVNPKLTSKKPSFQKFCSATEENYQESVEANVVCLTGWHI